MNIKYLNRTAFKAKVQKINDDYWNRTWEGRWKYMHPVIKEIPSLKPVSIVQLGNNFKILELGAYKINLTNISDNMDLEYDFIDPDNRNNKMYIQDAINLPWNIENKYYDVFIALQVFEHFENEKQSEVFKEVMRVSKNAILSFPYKWNKPDDLIHHMIDDYTIKRWTNGVTPEKVIYINVPKRRRRVIYVFKFKNN